jgi:MFS family permease
MAQICAMNQFSSLPQPAGRYAPDGAYAFTRLAVSLLIATLIGAGMWAVIVVLPPAQLDFGVDRSAASLPYTLMMCSLAFSTIALGRMTDRFGIVLPLAISAVTLGLGFVLAGYAPNLGVFTAAHVLIGIGAGTGFGPMMADISHWFVTRRGLAVVIVASGNYFAGTIWPLLMSLAIPVIGWRATYAGIGLIVATTVLPLGLAMRRRPSAAVYEQAEAATEAARADVGISPRLLLILLIAAGFSCCVAMSMPQVHLVAYCGDLGYGVARGAEMLSLMMALGVVSRIGSGFVADYNRAAPRADRIPMRDGRRCGAPAARRVAYRRNEDESSAGLPRTYPMRHVRRKRREAHRGRSRRCRAPRLPHDGGRRRLHRKPPGGCGSAVHESCST